MATCTRCIVAVLYLGAVKWMLMCVLLDLKNLKQRNSLIRAQTECRGKTQLLLNRHLSNLNTPRTRVHKYSNFLHKLQTTFLRRVASANPPGSTHSPCTELFVQRSAEELSRCDVCRREKKKKKRPSMAILLCLTVKLGKREINE